MFRVDAESDFCKQPLPLLAACVLVLTTSSPLFSREPQRKKQVPAWILRQEARIYGDQIVTLTENAMRIDCPRRGVYTVSVSPFKKVYTIDSRDKTYYQAGSEQSQGFVAQRMCRIIGMDPKKEKWVRRKKGSIAGIKAGLYASPESTDRMERDATETGSRLLVHLKQEGFWVAEDPGIPAGAAVVLSDLSGLPNLGKVPLQFKYLSGRRERVMLDTRSAERATVDPSLFDIPRGFKRVSSEYNTSRTDMTIFARPLGSKLR